MKTQKKTKVFVIDDNQDYIDSLANYFVEIPEVELVRSENDALNIRNTIISYNPDILLVDIEKLSVLNDASLEELINSKQMNFTVILYTNNNLIHLFQRCTIYNATDLLTSADLKKTIHTFSTSKNLQNSAVNHDIISKGGGSNKFIAFQTLIGLRFIDKKSIVYFEYTKDEKSERSLWEAYLDNAKIIKLKINTTSKDIMKHFENHDFIQISQSNIVNMNFFSSIELKSRKCFLHPPYENKEMIISRAYLNEIRNRFEID